MSNRAFNWSDEETVLQNETENSSTASFRIIKKKYEKDKKPLITQKHNDQNNVFNKIMQGVS